MRAAQLRLRHLMCDAERPLSASLAVGREVRTLSPQELEGFGEAVGCVLGGLCAAAEVVEEFRHQGAERDLEVTLARGGAGHGYGRECVGRGAHRVSCFM